MSKVTLDRETFKALASETRLQVLHALDERRKTGSELARELDLNKATIHEHLQILEATGLVAKKDEGRKWMYWELTWEGSKLLHPGHGAVFSVLLGLSVLATGGGIATLGAALGWWLDASDQAGIQRSEEPAGSPEAETAPSDEGSNDPETAAESQESGDVAAGAEESSMLEAQDGSNGFFDELGWSAIMLLFTAVVAVAMAVWLRRRR